MFCKNTPNVLQTPGPFVLCSSALVDLPEGRGLRAIKIFAHPVAGRLKIRPSAAGRSSRAFGVAASPSGYSGTCPMPVWPETRVLVPSRPGEFHPEPLTDPDRILSHHPARATARRLPPSAERRAPPGEPVGPNQRALLHLQYSCAAPFGPAMLVTQDPKPPCCAFATWRGPYAICDTGALPHSGQLHEGRARPRAPRTRLRRRAQSLQSLSAVLQTRIARQRPRKSAIASSRAPRAPRFEQFQLRVHRFCTANRVQRTASVTVPARKAVNRNGT